MFNSMAEKETIIDDLVKSFAPSIYGHEDVKKRFAYATFWRIQEDI